MARIFITGSSDGIGLLAARNLIAQGHQVTLHARNAERAAQAQDAAKGAHGVLTGDLSSLAQTKQLAVDVNKANNGEAFDVVIHNAGIGYTGGFKKTGDGMASTFQINSLAAYVLTSLMHKPKRFIYISSGLHFQGQAGVKDITWTRRSWEPYQAYCDSKLQNVLLAFAVARKWKDVESVAVSPGWVQTKIDGFSGPGSVEGGADTMTWLAGLPQGQVQSGEKYQKRQVDPHHEAADSVRNQEEYIKACEGLSGVSFPTHS